MLFWLEQFQLGLSVLVSWYFSFVTKKNLPPKEPSKVSVLKWRNTTHNVIQSTSEVQIMHRHRI